MGRGLPTWWRAEPGIDPLDEPGERRRRLRDGPSPSAGPGLRQLEARAGAAGGHVPDEAHRTVRSRPRWPADRVAPAREHLLLATWPGVQLHDAVWHVPA